MHKYIKTCNETVVIPFNYGNFALNSDFIIGKSLKALNVLLYNCKRYPMKRNVLCQHFDAFVGSILIYSSEVLTKPNQRK